jgi:hypothetical protein
MTGSPEFQLKFCRAIRPQEPKNKTTIRLQTKHLEEAGIQASGRMNDGVEGGVVGRAANPKKHFARSQTNFPIKLLRFPAQ